MCMLGNFVISIEEVWEVQSELCNTNLLNATPLYPSAQGSGCSQFKSHSLLSCFPPTYIYIYITGLNHQSIQTTCFARIMLSSCCNYCCYCNVDFYATLILFYHAFVLMLQNSSISCALWLPSAWYYEVSVIGYRIVLHCGFFFLVKLWMLGLCINIPYVIVVMCSLHESRGICKKFNSVASKIKQLKL